MDVGNLISGSSAFSTGLFASVSNSDVCYMKWQCFYCKLFPNTLWLATWPCLQTAMEEAGTWGCLDPCNLPLLENFKCASNWWFRSWWFINSRLIKAIFSWEAPFLCLTIYIIYMNKIWNDKWKGTGSFYSFYLLKINWLYNFSNVIFNLFHRLWYSKWTQKP